MHKRMNIFVQCEWAEWSLVHASVFTRTNFMARRRLPFL